MAQSQNSHTSRVENEPSVEAKQELPAELGEDQKCADNKVQKLERKVESRVKLYEESNKINLEAFNIEKGLIEENKDLVDFAASYYESMLYFAYTDSENRSRNYIPWEDEAFLSKFYDSASQPKQIGKLKIENKTLALIKLLESSSAKNPDLIKYWNTKKTEIIEDMENLDLCAKYANDLLKKKSEVPAFVPSHLSSEKMGTFDSVKNILEEHPYLSVGLGIIGIIATKKIIGKIFEAISPKGIFASIKGKILAGLGISAVLSTPFAIEGLGHVLTKENARKVVKALGDTLNIDIADQFVVEIAELLQDKKIPTEEKITKVMQILRRGENPNRELHLAGISDVKAKTGKDIHEATFHIYGTRPFKDFSSPVKKTFSALDIGRKLERELVSKIPFGEFMQAWIANPDLASDKEILTNEYFPKIIENLKAQKIQIPENATVNDVLALATGKENKTKPSPALESNNPNVELAKDAVVAGAGIDAVATSKSGLTELVNLVRENKWEKTSAVLQDISSHENIAGYLWNGLGTEKNPSKNLIKSLIDDGATLVAKEGVLAIYYGGKVFFLSTWEPLYDTFIGFMNPKPGEDRFDAVFDYTFAKGTIIMMGVHTVLNLADRQNVIKAFASGILKGVAAPISNAHAMVKWGYRGAAKAGDVISDSVSAYKMIRVPEGNLNLKKTAVLEHIEHYFDQWQKYQDLLNMKKYGYKEANSIAQRTGGSLGQTGVLNTPGKVFYSQEVLEAKVKSYGRSFYQMVDELCEVCGDTKMEHIDADPETRIARAMKKLDELKPKLKAMNIATGTEELLLKQSFQKKLGIAGVEGSPPPPPESPDEIWNKWIKEKARKMGYEVDLAKYPKITKMAKVMVKVFGPVLSILTIIRLHNAPDKRTAVLEEASAYGASMLACEGVTAATGNPLYGAGAAIFVGLGAAFGFANMDDEIKKKISDAVFPTGGHKIASEMAETMIHYQALMISRRFIGKQFSIKIGEKIAAIASRSAARGIIERLAARGGIKGGIAAAETFMVADDVAGPAGWLDMPLEIIFGGLLAYDAYDIYKSIDNSMKVAKYFKTNADLPLDQVSLLDSKGNDITSSSIFERHIRTNYKEFAPLIDQFSSNKETRLSIFKVLLQEIMHDEAKMTSLLKDFPQSRMDITRQNEDSTSVKMREIYNYESGKLVSVKLLNPDMTEYAKFESEDGKDLMYAEQEVTPKTATEKRTNTNNNILKNSQKLA